MTTNKDKTNLWGFENQFTSVNEYLSKNTKNINVLTAFSGRFNAYKIKELFVYRNDL